MWNQLYKSCYKKKKKKVLVKSLFNLILDFMVNLLRKFVTPYPLHKNNYNFGKGKTTITWNVVSV